MHRIHNLPEWFQIATSCSEGQQIPAITVAFEREGSFFFDGAIAALMGQGKIPHSIEMSLDMASMSCIARLNYGDQSDEEALYAPFEIESFAFLWNANPGKIHGLDSERITLALQASEARYPFINGAGITAELFLRNDLFVAQPNLDYAHEWEQAS